MLKKFHLIAMERLKSKPFDRKGKKKTAVALGKKGLNGLLYLKS